jgi:hypothetical protein
MKLKPYNLSKHKQGKFSTLSITFLNLIIYIPHNQINYLILNSLKKFNLISIHFIQEFNVIIPDLIHI